MVQLSFHRSDGRTILDNAGKNLFHGSISSVLFSIVDDVFCVIFFEQLDYDVSWCNFLPVSYPWYLLNLWVYSLYCPWKKISFSFFSPIPFLFIKLQVYTLPPKLSSDSL